MEILEKTVFLVGFMGSGKSTFGQELAKALNKPFVDLDAVIESTHGKSIGAIFQEAGENRFREMEREALMVCSNDGMPLIATGGGAPCYFDNMDYMNQPGYTVYLTTSAIELFERLLPFTETRPLLQGKDKDALQGYIETTLAKREPFYLKAQFILETDGLDEAALVKAFMAHITLTSPSRSI
jgi:shikimate kinase